jgi:nucleotide-binding universal stress UspA family protein
MQPILATVDFSDMTPQVVELAVRVARAMGAPLCLVHVGAAESEFFGHQLSRKEITADDVPERHQSAFEKLDSITQAAREDGVEARAVFVLGKPVETIRMEARRIEAQLIVLGSHGRSGLERVLMGSVSEGLVRVAPCPLLVVPRAPAS